MQLVSRSCTSGWSDWVWGDLWFTPDALVRVARGMDETSRATRRRKQRGGGSTVEAEPHADAPASETELRDRFARADRNRWVAFNEITQARLRRGIMNSRLTVVMRDGSGVKLLWLKHDPAYDVLRAVLGERLGANLILR
jgi:hypothetical protein